MNTEFINPNFHVALVHFPIALLIVGVLIELFSFMWRRHSFRIGGRWMILLGTLLGIPTALSGIYALKDVVHKGAVGVHPDSTWKELVKTSSFSDAQWEMLTDHLQLQTAAVVLALIASIFWIASSDRLRSRLQKPLLLVFLISAGLTITGAWHGGEAVYRYGTGVAFARSEPAPGPEASIVVTTAAETASTVSATQRGASTTTTTMSGEEAGTDQIFRLIQHYTSPVQTHLILAGVAVALACVALGLAIRNITQGTPVPQVDHIAAALSEPPSLPGGEAPPDVVLSDTQDLIIPRVPAARFWILAFVAALLTAGIGYYMLGTGSHVWRPNDLWTGFIREHVRRTAHVIAGVSIVLLSLILAGVARWAPRQTWLLAFFAFLLLVAVALQIWIGILLLYDTSRGPLTGFN